MHPTKLLLTALVALLLLTVACSDDDNGGDETPTIPTTDAAAEQTQAAVNTAEASSPVQPTRVPGPAVPPTKTTGTIILATTTSTVDSGLLDVLVPLFEDETGYSVQTLSLGSGAAIELGSRGDADVLLVHSPAAEQRMIDEGNGIERTLVMHNDFIVAGPASDPANVLDQERADDAFAEIFEAGATFISRGDESGTHALELRIWESAALNPSGQSWYTETGQGMGATLQIANQRLGYALTDRGTFLSQRSNLDLESLLDGDPALLNMYHVIIVNPDVHDDVNATGARAFAAFITRPDIQQIIGEFGVGEFGEPLFVPDAGSPDPTS
jgi:tungstate transport system substrate-binding protein